MIIKCQNDCPIGKGEYCCSQCEHKDTCEENICQETPSTSTDTGCGCAIFVEEETGISTFQANQAAIIQSIVDLCLAKKKLDEQEKRLKDQLKTAMELNNVKSFSNDVLKITYVAATTAISVDSKKLKEKHPEIYKECSKTSAKSAHVKVEVK